MMYRWHAGYVAWLLNRLTGVLISFYLVLHIWVMHHLAQGEEQYTKVMEFLSSKLFMFFELALMGVVLYHVMNGIRIVLVDLGNAVRHQKMVFWVLMGIGIALYVICAWDLAGAFLGLTGHEVAEGQAALM